MIGCSIQIYFGIFLEKSINTNVYVCDLAGLYHSKCHLCVFSFVQWLDGFGEGLVLCGKQQALGQGRRETCPCSYRRFQAAATLQDVRDTGWGFCLFKQFLEIIHLCIMLGRVMLSPFSPRHLPVGKTACLVCQHKYKIESGLHYVLTNLIPGGSAIGRSIRPWYSMIFNWKKKQIEKNCFTTKKWVLTASGIYTLLICIHMRHQ